MINAKQVINESISRVLNEYGVSSPKEAMDANKKINEAIKQEQIQDLESHKDASFYTKAIRKIKELGEQPLQGKHAALAASAIAAGLGALALAKKLRATKRVPVKASAKK
jgi:hypothetical protein